MSRRATNKRRNCRGFTMIEALVSVLLMTMILSALGMITAQWLPNWNRGIVRVQNGERLSLGMDRIVADLSAVEMITSDNNAATPFFDGSELSVTFVRTAIGPNTSPGLEIVRLSEKADSLGPALVRERARFTPMPPGTPIRFSDPVVLIRAPFRVAFAYAAADQVWQLTWHDAPQIPRLIRIAVRDMASQQILAASTAAIVHVSATQSCATATSVAQCVVQPQQGNKPNPLGGNTPQSANNPL
jgi:general secretion pathway protein J